MKDSRRTHEEMSDDIRRAYYNDPLVNAVFTQAEINSLTYKDTLELLVSHLLERHAAIVKNEIERIVSAPIVIKMTATEYLKLNPKPPINENV